MVKSKDNINSLATYKFEIKPNSEQKIMFNKTFGCSRKVYNLILAAKEQAYQDKLNGLISKIPTVTPASFKQEYPYLKEVDSLALANAQQDVETAYKNFFDKRANKPKFKSKHSSKSTYTTNCVNNNIKLINSDLYLPKLKQPVKVVLHRRIQEYIAIKKCTISMSNSGKYFVSITFKIPNREIISQPINPDRVLGLDYSSSALFVDSQGNTADYPRFYRKSQQKLHKLQRQLSKKMKGSNNRNKAKKKVSKLHEKIANQRLDFLHKLSHRITQLYDYVIVEDINLQQMSRCLKLGKSTMDNGFGMLRQFLGYKLYFKGGALIKIDKWFPSTKTCSECGHVQTMKLNDRTYICECCGTIIDRDYNAAINIKNEGLKILLS